MRDNSPQEQHIRQLLALIRFRYTRVAVKSPGYEELSYRFEYWKGVPKIEMPNFYKYTQGNYFPPIQAKLTGYGENSAFGANWGIFATSDIPVHALIG